VTGGRGAGRGRGRGATGSAGAPRDWRCRQRSCRSVLIRCIIIIQERHKANRYACRDHRLKGNYRSSNLRRVEKGVLIPDHITRYDSLFGFRIVENPCLVILWVANKGTLSGV
jgi:hypothetical protein